MNKLNSAQKQVLLLRMLTDVNAKDKVPQSYFNNMLYIHAFIRYL